MWTKHQFLTLLATILLVGAACIGANLTIAPVVSEVGEARFDQVDALLDRADGWMDWVDTRFDRIDGRFVQIDLRFDRIDARFDRIDRQLDRIDRQLDRLENRLERMQRRMDEGFREMGVSIARLEGLIWRFHSPARSATASSGRPAGQTE